MDEHDRLLARVVGCRDLRLLALRECHPAEGTPPATASSRDRGDRAHPTQQLGDRRRIGSDRWSCGSGARCGRTRPGRAVSFPSGWRATSSCRRTPRGATRSRATRRSTACRQRRRWPPGPSRRRRTSGSCSRCPARSPTSDGCATPTARCGSCSTCWHRSARAPARSRSSCRRRSVRPTWAPWRRSCAASRRSTCRGTASRSRCGTRRSSTDPSPGRRSLASSPTPRRSGSCSTRRRCSHLPRRATWSARRGRASRACPASAPPSRTTRSSATSGATTRRRPSPGGSRGSPSSRRGSPRGARRRCSSTRPDNVDALVLARLFHAAGRRRGAWPGAAARRRRRATGDVVLTPVQSGDVRAAGPTMPAAASAATSSSV